MATLRHYFASVLAVACTASLAHADVELDYFFDQESWEAAVGEFTTIDFTGFDNFEPLHDQYSDIGVSFEGNEHIIHSGGFVNDGEGMQAPGGSWIVFDEPQYLIAADHPGVLSIDLYFDGALVYQSGLLGGSGFGFFSGLVSSLPFDEVYLFKPEPFLNVVFIDDLHFGPPIPAPGALGVIVLGSLWLPRRRRP